MFSMIGSYHSSPAIVKHFKEVLKKPISLPTVQFYRHSEKWLSQIKKYREKYENYLFSVQLTSKRRRVEELQYLYYKLRDRAPEKASGIISKIREEMEGKGENNNFYQFNQYNALSDQEIKTKVIANARKLMDLQLETKTDDNIIVTKE